MVVRLLRFLATSAFTDTCVAGPLNRDADAAPQAASAADRTEREAVVLGDFRTGRWPPQEFERIIGMRVPTRPDRAVSRFVSTCWVSITWESPMKRLAVGGLGIAAFLFSSA